MNKLVSKNPILRFKEGKKILFAKVGDKFLYNGEEVVEEILDGQPILRRKNGTYIYPSNRNLTRLNGTPYRKVPTTPSDYSFMKGGTRLRTPEEILRLQDPKILTYLSRLLLEAISRQTSKLTPRVGKKTLSPSSTFSGPMGGWTKSMGLGNITDPDSRNMIEELGWKGKTAEQVQLLLNENNIGGYGVIVDNKWGNQSRNALKAYYDRWKDNQNVKTNIIIDPIHPITNSNYISPLNNYTPPTTPINLEVASLNLNVPTYVNANRSQTRDWMRSNGINPYSVSGAMRAAVRRLRARQADENDKLLVKGNEQLYNLLKDYYKQGGQLPSRNPIERFKNGGVLKFLNAGNLPTAPKAEDRYRNSRRDSVAYFTLTPDELGRSIKRITTPSNAKIQREIIFNRGTKDNDTIYTEVPEHTKRLPFFPPVNIIPRRGFSYAKTPEYETLKRRFNTAWNLAK